MTINISEEVNLKMFDLRFINLSALIIKVTNRCNLECKYCYEDIAKKGDILLIETFKHIAEKAITSSINKRLNFIFHGGEPTLVPLQWYSEAITFCLDLASKFNKTITFGLQTNLISVTDKKLLELNVLGIHIAASIDAFDDISLPERSFSKKAISNLHRAKALNIPVNVLSVINKSNFKAFKDFTNLLQNDFSIKSFKANVAYPVGIGKFAEVLTPEEIFQAKKDILLSMFYSKGLGVNEVNLLKQIRKYFEPSYNCDHEICDKQTCGAGKSVLGFNHKGDILPCGRFTWNDITYYLGNVYEQSDENAHDKLITNFQSQNPQNWSDCKTCSAKSVCNFGCQAFITRSIDKTNIECISTKLLYNFFEENKNELETVYNNNKTLVESSYGDYGTGYSDYSDSR